jgi:hypothetical protein
MKELPLNEVYIVHGNLPPMITRSRNKAVMYVKKYSKINKKGLNNILKEESEKLLKKYKKEFKEFKIKQKSKKRSSKKMSKKRSVKRSSKKMSKKRSVKRSSKKMSKKRSVKRSSKKRLGKKMYKNRF